MTSMSRRRSGSPSTIAIATASPAAASTASTAAATVVMRPFGALCSGGSALARWASGTDGAPDHELASRFDFLHLAAGPSLTQNEVFGGITRLTDVNVGVVSVRCAALCTGYNILGLLAGALRADTPEAVARHSPRPAQTFAMRPQRSIDSENLTGNRKSRYRPAAVSLNAGSPFLLVPQDLLCPSERVRLELLQCE